MPLHVPEGSSDPWADRSYPVEEDIPFQRAEWLFQRIAWAAMAVLVVLALLGMFSVGPLSWSTVSDPSGRLEVEYDRFARSGATTTMALRIAAEAGAEVAVRFNPEFMRDFTVETVQPEPAEVRSGSDGVELTFRASGAGPVVAYLSVRPEGIGLVRSEVALRASQPASLTQFIYP